MIPLAQLKQELEASRDLGDIIDILKASALIQFRSLQSKRKPNEEFSKSIEGCLEFLIESNISHPYLFVRKNLPRAIVIITSDEGFLGELNTLLINKGLNQRESKDDELIVLGDKGAAYLEELAEKITVFGGVSEEFDFRQGQKLLDYLLKRYRENYSRVLIVYPEFVSLTNQRIKVFQLLPCELSSREDAADLKSRGVVLIEPFLGRVLEVLVRLWLGARLFEVFWTSKQAEYAARIMHLEGSIEELSILNKKLSFEYFRQVHALSDKTIREVTASKVLLEKGRLSDAGVKG